MNWLTCHTQQMLRVYNACLMKYTAGSLDIPIRQPLSAGPTRHVRPWTPVSDTRFICSKKQSPRERKQIYHFPQTLTMPWNYITPKISASVDYLGAFTLGRVQVVEITLGWICKFSELTPGQLPCQLRCPLGNWRWWEQFVRETLLQLQVREVRVPLLSDTSENNKSNPKRALVN